MDYIKRIFTPAYWADAATMCCVLLMYLSAAIFIVCLLIGAVALLLSHELIAGPAIAISIISFFSLLIFGCLSGLFYTIHRIMVSAEQIAMSNEAILNMIRIQAKAQNKIGPKQEKPAIL